MHRLGLLALVIAAWGVLPGTQSQTQDRPDLQLKAAVYKETVEGDLQGAIAIYKEIVTNSAAPRPVAAAALLALGGCYEKLGQAQARGVYERLVADYPDQAQEAAQARARLAALSQAVEAGASLRGRRVIGPSYHLRGVVSLDGRFIASCCLTVHDVETGRDQTIKTSMATTSAPAFSPDSERIAYVAQPGGQPPELRVVDRTGGSDRAILSNAGVTAIALFGWMPDGQTLLVRLTRSDQSTELARVPAAGGQPLTVRSPSPYTGPAERGQLSRDGRYLAYRAPASAGSGRTTRVVAVDDGTDTLLVERPANTWTAGWTGDGRFAFYSADAGSEGLWTVRVANGRAQGSAERVVGKIDGDVQPIGLTETGAFFYFRQALDSAIHFLSVAPSGTVAASRVLASAVSPSWSANGQWLAYANGGSGLVTIQTVATGATRTLWTGLPGAIMALEWFPDRAALAAQGVGPDGGMNSIGLRRVDLASGSLSDVLLGQAWRQFGANPTFSPDGRYLLYKGLDSSRQITSLTRRDLQTRAEDVLLERKAPDYLSAFAVQASTGQIAFATQDTNDPNNLRTATSTIGVLDPVSGGTRILHRTAQGVYIPSTVALVWMPDGRSILFVSAPNATNGTPMSLYRLPVAGGPPEKIFEADTIFQVRVRPDGREIAIDTRTFRMETSVVERFLAPAGK